MNPINTTPMGTGGKHHPKFDNLSMSFEQGTRVHLAAGYQFLSLPVFNTLFQQQNWDKGNFNSYCQFHFVHFLYIVVSTMSYCKSEHLKRCPSQR